MGPRTPIICTGFPPFPLSAALIDSTQVTATSTDKHDNSHWWLLFPHIILPPNSYLYITYPWKTPRSFFRPISTPCGFLRHRSRLNTEWSIATSCMLLTAFSTMPNNPITSSWSVIHSNVVLSPANPHSLPQKHCVCTAQTAHTATFNVTHELSLISLLTYSEVQSPSWEANWFAASQEIPRISWNPKVHYRTHKRPPPVPILGQPNPAHIPKSHLPEIHPNIIHPSTPRSPHWSLSLRFPHQDPIRPPLLPHTRHMPCPSHSSRFYHPHNIGCGVQIT